jgi:hypothetical protein
MGKLGPAPPGRGADGAQARIINRRNSMQRLIPGARAFLAMTAATLLAGCIMVVSRPASVSPVASAEAADSRTAGPCSAGGGSAARIAASEQELEIGRMLENYPGQQRDRLVHNATLARIARQRAQDMGARNYFSHTDPDGLGANTLVTRAGYALPDFYDRSPAGNNIESIGGGYHTSAAAWAGWMNSPGHRTHLLGLQPFYRDQTDYGVGYAHVPGSQYGHYWVVLIAKPGC